MESKLPEELQKKVDDVVQLCIDQTPFIAPHIAVRSVSEAWAEKYWNLQKDYDFMAQKYNFLLNKYDAILATSDGHSSQTENVWQSGYAAGHDAGYERRIKDDTALHARCERMERAIKKALDLKALWQYSDPIDTEHQGEAEALAVMEHYLNEALAHNEREPDQPKLTHEQIQERKEAIEWIRNPDKERFDSMIELLGEARLQIEYLHNKFSETGSGNNILARISAVIDTPKFSDLTDIEYRGPSSHCKACEDERNGVKHLMAQKHTCRK